MNCARAANGQTACGNWPEKKRGAAWCGALALMLALGGCNSLRSVFEPKYEPIETQSAGGTGEAGTVVEEPIPVEAAQQFEQAVALMGEGKDAEAEQAFRAVSAAYPQYSGALLNIAILQTRADKLEEAEQTLKSAVARNAKNAAAYNQMGIIYRRLGRFADADEAYQKALQADATYAIAYLNLGVLCDLYLQQPERALQAFERYLQLAASPDARVANWVTELKARLGSDARSARS